VLSSNIFNEVTPYFIEWSIKNKYSKVPAFGCCQHFGHFGYNAAAKARVGLGLLAPLVKVCGAQPIFGEIDSITDRRLSPCP